MSYQCEWQDEVQSALWHRCSATLFTIAIYGNDVTSTALICSDTKSKDKTSTWAFLDHSYGILVNVSDDDNIEQLIWSDKPTSESKNRFMVKVCPYLSHKCALDFYNTATKLMKATKVSYISQEMIDNHNQQYPCDVTKVNGITKVHVVKVNFNDINVG